MAYAMDTWADTVYCIALSHAKSVPDAEDITQDVFVRLLKSTLAFEDDEHLKAWLISTTLNRCREMHRTTQRRKTLPVAELPDTRTSPPADEKIITKNDAVWNASRYGAMQAIHRPIVAFSGSQENEIRSRRKGRTVNSNPMNDYRDAMKEARLSPEQRARLEEAVFQARLRHEEGSVAQSAPRIVTRRTFAIGAAAAFVGLAGFGALNIIGGLPGKPAPNAFGLKAYALDDPARPSGYTETLTKNVLTSNVGGYFGAWEDENGNAVENVLGYAFRFDLECIGDNVESYSYRIEGDGAYFGLTGGKDGIPEEFFPDGSFYVRKYECSDSLFVTKENQQEFGPDKSFVPLIVLALPMDDEFRAAYDRASSLEHTDASEYDIIESGSAFDRFVELNASKKIAESTLYVTAAYEDGTAETKTYRIVPVEDFEERYLAFQELRDECILEEQEGESQDSAYPEAPELYTITQLS